MINWLIINQDEDSSMKLLSYVFEILEDIGKVGRVSSDSEFRSVLRKLVDEGIIELNPVDKNWYRIKNV